MLTIKNCIRCRRFTLMMHANTAGVEADVVLVSIAFVLSDAEQNAIFHLEPELAVFVFQYGFVFLLK